jgi:ribosomal protein L29
MSHTSTPVTELTRMTAQELRKELQVKRAECARMRIAIEMGAEKNHASYKLLRRDVARMTMVLDHMPKTPVAAKETPVKTSQTKTKSVKGSRSKSKK